MSHEIATADLLRWCRVPYDRLVTHPERRMPLRLVPDAAAMGELMAAELVDTVEANNRADRPTRAIVPCGPRCWYAPFVALVNRRRVPLRRLEVFHMDECLDWQGRLLPKGHPYNFRTFMERHFYAGIAPELAVPEAQRRWLTPASLERVLADLHAAPIDLALGGWGQDGHLAYNQARREPFYRPTLDELRACTGRVQDNNPDTIVALAQRCLGSAFRLVPPMSVTLGMRECLSARRVRVFSDTGAWKQTALRLALFSPPTVECPLTLLQEHPDALITATVETATHPLAEHPEWDFERTDDVHAG